MAWAAAVAQATADAGEGPVDRHHPLVAER
jgi:hypothetical protein